MDKETLQQFSRMLSARLKEMLPETQGGVFGSEDHRNNRDPMDEVDLASAGIEREFSLQIQQRNRESIREIVNALKRIENGEYGICEECGSSIEIKRLKAQPMTTVCIECKRQSESAARLRTVY